MFKTSTHSVVFLVVFAVAAVLLMTSQSGITGLLGDDTLSKVPMADIANSVSEPLISAAPAKENSLEWVLVGLIGLVFVSVSLGVISVIRQK